MMRVCLAAAGAGKTTWLVEQACEAQATGALPARMLALTFSRAQGADLGDRLESALGVPVGYAGTIHGWALQLLEDHAEQAGMRPGISVYDEADEALVLEELARDLGYRKGQRWTCGLSRDLLRRAASAELGEGPVVEAEGQTLDALRLLIGGSRARRRTANALTYGELIHEAVRLLERSDVAVARSYDLVLVDEAQDLSAQQWLIVHLLRKLAPLSLVGDPRQAIYGWRGSCVNPLLELAREAEAAGRLTTLTRCYRCGLAILDAADKLISSDSGAAFGGHLGD